MSGHFFFFIAHIEGKISKPWSDFFYFEILSAFLRLMSLISTIILLIILKNKILKLCFFSLQGSSSWNWRITDFFLINERSGLGGFLPPEIFWSFYQWCGSDTTSPKLVLCSLRKSVVIPSIELQMNAYFLLSHLALNLTPVI